MTPTEGDGSVEGNGSHPQSGYLNGTAAPPLDPARVKINARREASISLAVDKALNQRTPNGNAPPALADAALPAPNGNVNGDPDHPVHKVSRGHGVLPPDIRKRLQADILPQVPPSGVRKVMKSS